MADAATDFPSLSEYFVAPNGAGKWLYLANLTAPVSTIAGERVYIWRAVDDEGKVRIIVGGAPMGEQLMERVESGLGAIVQTSWGMTELTPLGAIAPAGLSRREAASSGRSAIGVDFLLKDVNDRPLPDQRGGEGRLHVKGQSVVNRYFGHASPSVDADGWFDTGDLARIGADGSLYITGRAKDLIKSGGEWINPAEIEAIVGASPLVAQTAVIARRDRNGASGRFLSSKRAIHLQRQTRTSWRR